MFIELTWASTRVQSKYTIVLVNVVSVHIAEVINRSILLKTNLELKLKTTTSAYIQWTNI